MGSLTGLILFMLLSRPQPNIDERDLGWIEESTDFADFTGFFREPKVKALYDLVLKHLAQVIKKKAARQREVEVVLTSCIVNFECSDPVYHLIRKYVADSLARLIDHGSMGGGSLNADFNFQQQ